jgi:acyl-coenzyme A thioesterase PaaI-like protein
MSTQSRVAVEMEPMAPDLEAVHGFFSLSSFIVDPGVEPAAVPEGRMTTELIVAPRHLQHTGQVPAGVTATLAVDASKP